MVLTISFHYIREWQVEWLSVLAFSAQLLLFKVYNISHFIAGNNPLVDSKPRMLPYLAVHVDHFHILNM